MDLTAVDIDGDNSRVREFIDMHGQSSSDVPTVIPSLLTISNVSGHEGNNNDDHGGNDGDNSGSGNSSGGSFACAGPGSQQNAVLIQLHWM